MIEALNDESWVLAMQEKLAQFEENNVWRADMNVIGTQ